MNRLRRDQVARTIAGAFSDGVWLSPDMAARAAHDLGANDSPCIHTIAVQVVAAFETPPHDAPRALARFVAQRLDALTEPESSDELLHWISGHSTTTWRPDRITTAAPIGMGTRPWSVREIHSIAELGAFLGLDRSELDWYSDVRSIERTARHENLRHYSYRWHLKRSGGARLVEAPKQNLKSLQRKILRDVLNPIPVHAAAHGFCRGRSIHTFAAPHVDRHVVIRVDLRAFFTTIRASRIFGIFRTAGYPEDVAHVLTGLVTNVPPAKILAAMPGLPELPLLRAPHLPQGAPTSPALANLAAFSLDSRLDALVASFDATYTRYADDLAFSGGERLARKPHGLLAAITEIVGDEGFTVNTGKTRIRSRSQRQVLTGMVVNKHLNVHRRDYDQLKAMLHSAVVHGPDTANRGRHNDFRAHLEGRISFVQATNPDRARRLWATFDKVQW